MGNVYCPSPFLHKDAICPIRTRDGKVRVALMEWKLRKDLPFGVCDAAVSTTKYDTVYTTKDGSILKTCKRARTETLCIPLPLSLPLLCFSSSIPTLPFLLFDFFIALLEQKFSANKGTLRIVFLYPHAHEEITPKVDNGDIVIVLDRKWAPDLFEKKVWLFLDSLKNYDD